MQRSRKGRRSGTPRCVILSGLSVIALLGCSAARAAAPEPPETPDTIRLGWTSPAKHPHVFPGVPTQPVLVADGQKLHLMAAAWDGTTYTEVFVSTHDDVGWWTDFSRLSTSGLQSTRIAAVADRGIVHVTWGERSTPHPFDSRPDMILYSNNEGGVWSEPVRLFHNPRHVFSRA
jgi:hypothetical protein